MHGYGVAYHVKRWNTLAFIARMRLACIGQVIDAVNGTHGEFEGSSFVEMINWVKQQLEVIQQATPLRLKVVYDKKGYTKVSSLGIFVEPMSIEQSQIKLWKNDLLERPIVADKESTIDPLAGQDMSSIPVTEATGADDLPF